MAYPSWPYGVQYKPLRADYAITSPHLPPLQTDMNAGNTRSRRQFTAAIGQLQVSIQMRDDEFDIFAPWERDTLGHGASRFTVPIYYRRSGWIDRTCWFEKGTYSAKPDEAAGYMRVNFILNVLDL